MTIPDTTLPEGQQTAARQFWAGVRAEFPLLVGVFPFGMIYGALALNAGLSQAAAQAMSSIVFAGSAQFVTTQLVRGGAPALVIVLTIFVVNLRHALYSASVSPYIESLPRSWKTLLAYLLTDEAYAVTIVEFQRNRHNPHKHWFYLGAGLALWTIWQISTAAGVFLGANVPADWALDFTLALTFIAMLIPLLRDRPAIASMLAAGATALLAYDLPYRLGLVAAALAGILTGMLLERRR